jgi:hypothetical protein
MKRDADLLPRGIRFCRLLNHFTVLVTLVYIPFMLFQTWQITPEFFQRGGAEAISPYLLGSILFRVFFKLLWMICFLVLNAKLSQLQESARFGLVFLYASLMLDYYFVGFLYLIGIYFLLWNSSTVEVLTDKGPRMGKALISIVLGFLIWGLTVGTSLFLENRTEQIEARKIKQNQMELEVIKAEQLKREQFLEGLPDHSQYDEGTGDIYF